MLSGLDGLNRCEREHSAGRKMVQYRLLDTSLRKVVLNDNLVQIKICGILSP